MTNQNNYEKKLRRWEEISKGNSAYYLLSAFLFIAIFVSMFMICNSNQKYLEEGSEEFEKLKSNAITVYTAHVPGTTASITLDNYKFEVSDEKIKASISDYIGTITLYYNSNGELDYTSTGRDEYYYYYYPISPFEAIISALFGAVLGAIFTSMAIEPFAEWKVKKIKEAMEKPNT